MTLIPNYNPKKVEAQTEFDALPAGDYAMIATEGEIKDTKAMNGKYVQFTNEVIEGQYKGRKLWTRFNVVNPNDKAVQIGRSQLKQFAESIKNPDANDVSAFLNKPFVGKVTMKNDAQHGASNDVKGFKPYGVQETGATTGATDKPSWA